MSDEKKPKEVRRVGWVGNAMNLDDLFDTRQGMWEDILLEINSIYSHRKDKSNMRKVEIIIREID